MTCNESFYKIQSLALQTLTSGLKRTNRKKGVTNLARKLPPDISALAVGPQSTTRHTASIVFNTSAIFQIQIQVSLSITLSGRLSMCDETEIHMKHIQIRYKCQVQNLFKS